MPDLKGLQAAFEAMGGNIVTFGRSLSAVAKQIDVLRLQRDYARARCRLLESSLRWDGGKGIDKHARAKKRMKKLRAELCALGARP